MTNPSTPLPEQRGCNVPRCGVWPIYKEGLCGSHYMEKHCPREGEYVSKYDPLPEQGGFNERLDATIDLLPCITGSPWANGTGKGMTFSDGEGFDVTEEVNAFKTAICTLILEEIIGKDSGCGFCGDIRQAEQRKKLGDTHGTK